MGCPPRRPEYHTFIPSTLYGPGYNISSKIPHFIFDLIKKILRGKIYGEKRLNRLNEIKNSIIILFGYYNANFTEEKFKKNKYFEFDLEIKSYTKFFENLIENNNQIFFIKPNPVILNSLWNYGNGTNLIELKRFFLEGFKEPKLKYLESVLAI